ncbi:MAG: UDP-N-acetylmuramoyl-L-alanyl-D-glutamate--2,6-diaminopimelate ligase [Clostridia bacterium]|nr:UDP-N-acetylmuramoyl-L-alanyl-D-glutamate--2,6-diaminopimelate ligase [Clostridia bacterium]MDQ7791464.1 UDP-N-acetylmuramoyl-L-alanyl-D-glutamate--2,6-diaminopimelate ligase [Clostridia bacterium]
MLFKELVKELTLLATGGDLQQPVAGIAYDSRQVRPGFLFVAIRGLVTDGHHFIDDALKRGASGLLVEQAEGLPDNGIGWTVVADTRRALGHVSARFYGFPAKQLHIAGVTGTNGKTTTTHLVAALYRLRAPVGLIGTIHNLIGERTLPVERTTPESLDLQLLLRQMVDEGVQRVAMEVSSHALTLNRVAGCDFRSAVFTNLTQDHLDFHRDMNDYFQAKASLFLRLGAGAPSVVNVDDPYGVRLVQMLGDSALTYGLDARAAVRATEPGIGPRGTEFKVESEWGRFQVDTRLVGQFNVYNALAAVALGLAEGFTPSEIRLALSGVRGIPGRFEPVYLGQDFGVIVDYAHTPDGLENVLRAARKITMGRVITVFGCGGDRDRTKRPIMGRIAVGCSDLAIVTSDNPRTEDPLSIIEQVEVGVREVKPSGYLVVPDRREAIGRAIAEARAGDIVVIAGKGHEDYQIIGKTKFPFDDRLVAAEKLADMGYTLDDETHTWGSL